MCGGRLGTNLLELGFIDLDMLTRALGTQLGLPGAVAHHFENVDEELQQRLSPETAQRFESIPLRHVFGRRHGVVIASAAPLSPIALADIAAELLVEPAELIQAIAAEMRIKYHLHRVYGVVRAARFLRLRESIPGSADQVDESFTSERRHYLESRIAVPGPLDRMARGSREMILLQRADSASRDESAFAAMLEAIRVSTETMRCSNGWGVTAAISSSSRS